MRVRSLFIGLLFCPFLIAQTGTPDRRDSVLFVPTSATTEQLREWLHGNDPRMVAWGAFFAREQKNDAVVGDMISLLRNWKPIEGSRENTPQDAAMWLVLDALIQRNLKVPADAIDSISQSFPAAAAILISRIPYEEEAKPVLLKWYGDGSGEDRTRLKKIAAMMLAKKPPPGFAASVLRNSEEWLWVDVYDDQPHNQGFLGQGTCGDSLGRPAAKGWPETFFYFLEENGQRKSGEVVVDMPNDRIMYQRQSYSRGWGSCYGVRALDAYARHQLIAEMQGVSDRSLPWQVRSSDSLKWSNAGQFQADLNDAVQRREKAFQATIEALHAHGLLSDEEAQSTRPKLLVYISDVRTKPGTSIPEPVFKDQRTSWTTEKLIDR